MFMLSGYSWQIIVTQASSFELCKRDKFREKFLATSRSSNMKKCVEYFIYMLSFAIYKCFPIRGSVIFQIDSFST